MKKLKKFVKNVVRKHYMNKCEKNVNERTKLLDELNAMKYEENPEAFKEILANVTELSEKYDKLHERRIKYY